MDLDLALHTSCLAMPRMAFTASVPAAIYDDLPTDAKDAMKNKFVNRSRMFDSLVDQFHHDIHFRNSMLLPASHYQDILSGTTALPSLQSFLIPVSPEFQTLQPRYSIGIYVPKSKDTKTFKDLLKRFNLPEGSEPQTLSPREYLAACKKRNAILKLKNDRLQKQLEEKAFSSTTLSKIETLFRPVSEDELAKASDEEITKATWLALGIDFDDVALEPQ